MTAGRHAQTAAHLHTDQPTPGREPQRMKAQGEPPVGRADAPTVRGSVDASSGCSASAGSSGCSASARSSGCSASAASSGCSVSAAPSSGTRRTFRESFRQRHLAARIDARAHLAHENERRCAPIADPSNGRRPESNDRIRVRKRQWPEVRARFVHRPREGGTPTLTPQREPVGRAPPHVGAVETGRLGKAASSARRAPTPCPMRQVRSMPCALGNALQASRGE